METAQLKELLMQSLAHERGGVKVYETALKCAENNLDWQLIAACAAAAKGDAGKMLKDAADEVEEEEDEHLYHTQGRCRELWFKALL